MWTVSLFLSAGASSNAKSPSCGLGSSSSLLDSSSSCRDLPSYWLWCSEPAFLALFFAAFDLKYWVMLSILPILVVFFWPLSDGTGEFLKDFSFVFGFSCDFPNEEGLVSMESFGFFFPFEFFEFLDEVDLWRAVGSSEGVEVWLAMASWKLKLAMSSPRAMISVCDFSVMNDTDLSFEALFSILSRSVDSRASVFLLFYCLAKLICSSRA